MKQNILTNIEKYLIDYAKKKGGMDHYVFSDNLEETKTELNDDIKAFLESELTFFEQEIEERSYNKLKMVNDSLKKQNASLEQEVREKTIADWEDLHEHVASALMWSDKHDKDEMLGAILNHVTKLGKKYGAFKEIPLDELRTPLKGQK